MDAMGPLDPTDPVEDAELHRRLHCDVEAEVRSGLHNESQAYSDEKLHHAISRGSRRSTDRAPSPMGGLDYGKETLPEEAGNPDMDCGISSGAPESQHTIVEEVDDDKPVYEDPGLWGWLDCLGTVLVNMICYGITQSFGVFQEYYKSNLLKDSTGMAISWIGAIQFCLCPMLGCIAGPLFDAGYLKPLLIAGGSLYSFCLMMTSISTEYYQVLLAHGIGVGLGMGLIFSPSVSTLQHHFGRSRYRTLAYGFQASGSAIAGIYFPIAFNYLIPAVGFPWTMRILGFIVLLFVSASYVVLSTTVPPRKEIALMSPKVFNNPAYAVYVGGACLCSLAIYAPQTFGVTYATYRGVPLTIANYTPAISNGVSLIGRILPQIIAQRVGPINVLNVAACMSGVVQCLWTLTRGTAAILVYDAMYGIVSGMYGASLNPGAATFAPHTNQAGLYLGMCFFTTSWFWLAGTPISAQLIDGKGSYLAASLYGGGVLLMGGCLIGTARWMRGRQVGTPWV